MSYAIVYSSRTGNTELLARAIQSALPAEDCLYFGGPDAAALAADRLYVGFWTDKGSCDEELAAFLVRGAAEGAVRSQLPPMETVLLFWSALSGMVHTADIREGYIQKTIGLSREEFLQHGTRLLLASITKVNA